MLSPGFEPAVTTIEWPQTYALDRTATEIADVRVGAVRFILTEILIV
jgi:hypothetical protein